jgi:transcriptional regulator with XRE-family HTH domain
MKSTIGERIRILRAIKSLSQENMANELDISVASYSNIERDVTDLTVSRLLKIAKILGIKASDILEMETTNVIAESDQKGYKSAVQLENSIDDLKIQMMKMAAELETLKGIKSPRKQKRK